MEEATLLAMATKTLLDGRDIIGTKRSRNLVKLKSNSFFVTTSKAPVTTSVALVTTSILCFSLEVLLFYLLHVSYNSYCSYLAS